jgi:hypothetical protein
VVLGDASSLGTTADREVSEPVVGFTRFPLSKYSASAERTGHVVGCLVEPRGLEPRTSAVQGRRSPS